MHISSIRAMEYTPTDSLCFCLAYRQSEHISYADAVPHLYCHLVHDAIS